MANCIGYEKVHVGTRVAAPTDATIAGGVVCAIFYLDPAAAGRVNWRCDGVDPTALVGLPVYPGGSFVLVGEGNIRKTRFVADVGAGGDMHISYFDRVDTPAIAFLGNTTEYGGAVPAGNELTEIINYLRQIRLGLSLQSDVDLSKE